MSPDRPTAYDVLGVAPTASGEEIRRAYRRAAKACHPDRHGGSEDAARRFLEVQAAFSVLSDPERRAAHDQDPSGSLETEVAHQNRLKQLKRRRARLRRLYE